MPLPADLAGASADIHLLDKILRGRIGDGMTALDVGCGDGRNDSALLATGCAASAVDAMAGRWEPCARGSPGATDRVVAWDLEALPFPAGSFAVVVVNAVLHFAPDRDGFHRWADACWRQLVPGRLALARLSTRIGLPDARPPGFAHLATKAAERLRARHPAIRIVGTCAPPYGFEGDPGGNAAIAAMIVDARPDILWASE